MPITSMSSREFNQDAGKAKKASIHGPVIITDRGRPAHVLLSIEEYRRLACQDRKIADLLAMPGIEDVVLPLRRSPDRARGSDFS